MFWYEDEVKQLEKQVSELKYEPGIVFYGSSSIRMWSSLYTDFPAFKPVNLGFGGSTLAACVWFFNRLLAPLKPRGIIFYAGDNDLGDGRHPEEVFIFFTQLLARVKQSFGDIPFAFISIKPSIARWSLNDQIKYANKLIQQETAKHKNVTFIDIYSQMTDTSGLPKRTLFEPDGLHLSEQGYAVWRVAVANYLQKLQL
jgi:lysophospholipase L1-like esterase